MTSVLHSETKEIRTHAHFALAIHAICAHLPFTGGDQAPDERTAPMARAVLTHTNVMVFETKAQAVEWLEMSGYQRPLVAQSPVMRWSATKWDDYGVKFLSLASSAGTTDAGEFKLEIADYGRSA
jgi:hypothetical protein